MTTPNDSSDHKGEGESFTPVGTRRTFFVRVIGLVSAVMGLSLAGPLVGYIISPSLKRRKAAWRPIAKVDSLPVGQPKDLEYAVSVKDGWRETKAIKAVWAVKHSDNDVTVFSPICPHLGCGFRWDGGDRQFKCPCHGSIYDVTGKVLGGPAPRPLDTLPSKIENGELLVTYKEYKSGLRKKVEL